MVMLQDSLAKVLAGVLGCMPDYWVVPASDGLLSFIFSCAYVQQGCILHVVHVGLFHCLNVCLSIYLSVCLSVYPSIYLSTIIYTYIYLSSCLSMCSPDRGNIHVNWVARLVSAYSCLALGVRLNFGARLEVSW